MLPKHHLLKLPAQRHYSFHTMIKPTGSVCNLDCPYCFYLHKGEMFEHEKNAQMNDEVLEQHIRQYIEANTSSEVVFSWQGGEPTLMGLAFFEKAVELQRRYAKKDQIIQNDLQTNGFALNEKWARFLKKEQFMVGLSIDGPKHLHDKYRFTKNGVGSFDKVMQSAELLRRYEIPFAALCVVNKEVAREPVAVWRFLTEEVGTDRIQFTPCVESKSFAENAPALIFSNHKAVLGDPRTNPDHHDSIVTEWSVDAEDYGNFLISVWELWLNDGFGKYFVNIFETAVAQSLGLPAQTCVSSPVCGKALAVEHDGTLFSCDHFVYPEFKLGNILQTHEGDMAFSKQQIDFGFAKSKALPQYCRSCESLNLCWGECPKNRLLITPDGEPGLNYLCSALKKFYRRVSTDMPVILNKLGINRSKSDL